MRDNPQLQYARMGVERMILHTLSSDHKFQLDKR